MSGQLVLPGVDTEAKPHRLLACFTCLTIEKLPPYTGPENDQGIPLAPDHALDELVKRHRTDGQPHRGILLRVDEKTWDHLEARTEISRQLFKDEWTRVSFRDTLTEDAVKCFNKHKRPVQGCIDYQDSSKRLGRFGSEKRQGAAMLASPVYLCDFCPVKSGYVDVEIRHKRGAYK